MARRRHFRFASFRFFWARRKALRRLCVSNFPAKDCVMVSSCPRPCGRLAAQGVRPRCAARRSIPGWASLTLRDVIIHYLAETTLRHGVDDSLIVRWVGQPFLGDVRAQWPVLIQLVTVRGTAGPPFVCCQKSVVGTPDQRRLGRRVDTRRPQASLGTRFPAEFPRTLDRAASGYAIDDHETPRPRPRVRGAREAKSLTRARLGRLREFQFHVLSSSNLSDLQKWYSCLK